MKHLPDDSATKRAMSQDPWPLQLHLLASVIDEHRLGRAEFAMANGAGTVKPKLVPRPAESGDREQVQDVHDALMSMMAPPTPELEDARARLQREQPQAPQVELD